MEALQKKLEEMELEISSLKKKEISPKIQKEPKAPKTVRIQVAEKSGGLSVYGYGKFPITQPANIWKHLLSRKEEILEFIEQHEKELTADRPIEAFILE